MLKSVVKHNKNKLSVHSVIATQRDFRSFPARTPSLGPWPEHDFEVGGFSMRHGIYIEEKTTWMAILDEIQQISPAMTVRVMRNFRKRVNSCMFKFKLVPKLTASAGLAIWSLWLLVG